MVFFDRGERAVVRVEHVLGKRRWAQSCDDQPPGTASVHLVWFWIGVRGPIAGVSELPSKGRRGHKHAPVKHPEACGACLVEGTVPRLDVLFVFDLM